MIAAVRLYVLAVLGLVLLAGCGNEQGAGTAAEDSPSPSVATSQAVSEATSSTDLPVADPITISLYDADFTVNASGDLAVVETLTLDVPVDDRHGIYRSFDRGVAVEGFTATLGGNPTPINDTTENGETRGSHGSAASGVDVETVIVPRNRTLACVFAHPDDDAAWRALGRVSDRHE